MGSPLNRLPNGLLDFFGIKAGGWGPRELGQVLDPSIDLLRWYCDTNAIELNCIVNAGAPFGPTASGFIEFTSTSPNDLVGGAGFLTVPNDEIWLILEASVRIGMAAGAGYASATFNSGITNQATINWALEEIGFNTADATTGRAMSSQLMQPRFVLGGQRIRLFGHGFGGAAASNTVSAQMRLVRFKR